MVRGECALGAVDDGRQLRHREEAVRVAASSFEAPGKQAAMTAERAAALSRPD
jgi:hypothetical protein